MRNNIEKPCKPDFPREVVIFKYYLHRQREIFLSNISHLLLSSYISQSARHEKGKDYRYCEP